MSHSYQETLNGESLSRYKSKLSVINCKECPYKLPAGVWENNKCPDLQYGGYVFIPDRKSLYITLFLNNL